MRWALIDFHHPFFRPLIRRIVVFCVVAIWTVVEYFGGSLGWTIFFLAAGDSFSLARFKRHCPGPKPPTRPHSPAMKADPFAGAWFRCEKE